MFIFLLFIYVCVCFFWFFPRAQGTDSSFTRAKSIICVERLPNCVQRHSSSLTSASSVSAPPSSLSESFNSRPPFSERPSSPCSALSVPPLLQFKALGMRGCAQMFSPCACLTVAQRVSPSRCSVLYRPPSPLWWFLCKHQIAPLLPSSWRKPRSRWGWSELCSQPLGDGLCCKGAAEHRVGWKGLRKCNFVL